MGESFIRAMERADKPKKTRQMGFAPGVVYGEGIEGSVPVKFEMKKLKRLLKGCRGNAKLQVKMGDELKDCILKEVQKNPITGDIIHIDLQIISEHNNIRAKIPIVFTGKSKLDEKKLLLHVYMSEVELLGKPGMLPKYIHIDVSGKMAGDKVLASQIPLHEEIRFAGDRDCVLAAVTASKELEIAS